MTLWLALGRGWWRFVWRTFERYGWPDVRWAPWVFGKMIGRTGVRVK